MPQPPPGQLEGRIRKCMQRGEPGILGAPCMGEPHPRLHLPFQSLHQQELSAGRGVGRAAGSVRAARSAFSQWGGPSRRRDNVSVASLPLATPHEGHTLGDQGSRSGRDGAQGNAGSHSG